MTTPDRIKQVRGLLRKLMRDEADPDNTLILYGKIEALSWVIGENPKMDRQVREAIEKLENAQRSK